MPCSTSSSSTICVAGFCAGATVSIEVALETGYILVSAYNGVARSTGRTPLAFGSVVAVGLVVSSDCVS